VSLTLQASKGATSDADILSRPAGAAVTMDGQKIGQTPLRGYKLRVGNRRFRLETEGYEPFTEFLKVEEGKTARLDARMLPKGSSPPPVTASKPAANSNGGAAYMENEVDTPPKKLSGADYQPKLKAGEVLSVTLSWVVDDRGDVNDVEVVESAGKAVDELVMQTVRKWKYTPAVKQGAKVKVQMARKFTFKVGS
jgi:TonB family protein